MSKPKETVVQRLFREVMQELTRIDGEDYDEYMETVRYEVNERLKEIRDNDLYISKVRYD